MTYRRFWHKSKTTCATSVELITIRENQSTPPFFTCLSGARVVHVFTPYIQFSDVRCEFRVQAMLFAFTLICVVEGSCYIYINCIYLPVSHTISISDHVRVCLRVERVWLEMQNLLILQKYLNSPPVFSGIRDAQSLVVCIVFWSLFASFLFSFILFIFL